MRILAIRGRNLASLAGDFELDFRSGPLAEGGLFAITGPTGAGKSTLLDALCLALFDRTPRLDDRGGVLIGAEGEGDEEKVRSSDVRSLLRRGAAEARAEVDFVCRDGREWRATWSVRRARGKAKGKLQDQAVVLVDLATGEPFQGKKTETLKAIEERVGLSFEQFRQSVLLAQGEFARFLKADGNERAGLLERMTGTEIYSRISIAAHERKKATGDAVKAAEAALQGIRVLAEEERAAAECELAEAAKGAVVAQERVAGLEELSRRAVSRGELERKRGAREREEADARNEEAEAIGRQAAAEESLVESEASVVRLVDERADLEPAISAAREVDGTLAAEARNLGDARKKRDDATARASRERKAAGDAAALAGGNRAAVEASEARLSGMAAAKPLVARREAWKRSLEELDRLTGEQRGWLEQRAREEKAENRARGVVEEERAAVGRLTTLVEEKKAEHEVVAAACLEAWALETRRAALVSGEPCPLCGAKEHPWAGGVPAGGAARGAPELMLPELEREKALRQELAEREKEKAGHEAAFRAGETAALLAASRVGEADRRLQSLAESQDLERKRLSAALQGRPDVVELAGSDPSALREVLVAEADAWTSEAEHLAEGRRIQALLDSDAAEAEARAKAAEDEMARVAYEAMEQAATHDAVAAQRATLLSGRPVAEVEGQLKGREKAAGEASATARIARDTARVAQARAEEKAREAGRKRGEAVAAAEDTAEALAKALRDAGLADEAALEAARTGAKAAEAAALDRRTEADVRLRQDDESRRRKAEHGEKLETARRDARVWGEVGAVIGHSEGASFRKFAQGLTLDALVAHANMHLAELAKRYRLERVPRADMDLMVVDQDMGDEARSVHSLSGGETFLVSLALALGLSSLATRKTRVESLFVDEGFGALDPQTLDTALAVLEALQARGRRVGVISHVPGLSERIGVRVAVTPEGGGRSRVAVERA